MTGKRSTHSPLALDLSEPYAGPLVCDDCCRFVSVKEAHLLHDFGDYGQHYNTEVFCPRCSGRNKESCDA